LEIIKNLMQINPDTKIIARINKKANSRGIAPYNKYFERSKTNAICLELHNSNLLPLLNGIKSLNMSGAITVAFEYDKELFDSVDEIDSVAKRTNIIGFITNRNGRLKGYAQGGYGLLNALLAKNELKDKRLVIFGAGHMTKGLLTQMEVNKIKPKSVEIFNRSIKKANKLAKEFKLVKQIGKIDEMVNARGDVFINTTDIGAPWRQGQDYKFSEKMINKFDVVADVIFVPLKTPLIKLAEKLGKVTSPGWETFMYGTKMVFETILDVKVDVKILGEELVKDFKANWS